MKYIIYPTLLLSLLLVSCKSNKQENQKKEVKEAKGGRYYGEVFRMNEIENFSSLFPLSVTDIYSNHITSQVYQGLLKFNQKTLEPQPCLATSFKMNDDATTFTYTLRDSVYFHDDDCFADGEGRLLTVKDVKYSLDKVCSSDPLNKMYWLFQDKVKGAVEYYESTQKGQPLEGGVSGIKVIDDKTIQIELVKPFAGFNNIMAHYGTSIFPKEAYEQYGRKLRTHGVGTGPFKIKTVKEGDAVVLSKNENYWEKDEFGNLCSKRRLDADENEAPFCKSTKRYFTFIVF